jgi:hypothetical protein
MTLRAISDSRTGGFHSIPKIGQLNPVTLFAISLNFMMMVSGIR